MSSVTSLTSHEISAYMRVASLAIALYDYLQTVPFELRIYREQWRARHLTLSFILFCLIRYISIIVLIVSNFGFFYPRFTPESCIQYYLLPSSFKVLQAMVSQAILGVRAYNLSRKSGVVGCFLGLLYVMSCACEWVSTEYGRRGVFDSVYRNCRSTSSQHGFGGWIHYAVAVCYDFIVSVVCIVFLLKLRTTATSLMARVTKMLLADGIWYFMALAMVNLLNLAFNRFSQEDELTAAASLGYSVTWIMSQKLIIHLHEASLERRNESLGAAVTITQEIASARDVSRALRSQYQSKSGFRGELTLPDFDSIESQSNPALGEDVEVQVRIERTVRKERVSRMCELEDYSRAARSNRSIRFE
ncbi:hypothetical protein B0H10DRAFT_2081250 [Mycena sp. CBHHK59/15]|nr:hypothetical protein B0H10DRAFT_2081250 [Mycena sp. CBHHK59/15]